MNNDGSLDVVVSHGTANVTLGNGDGTFKVGTDLAPSSFFQYTVTLGDVNNDGWLDIVTGTGNGPPGVGSGAHVYFNKGYGSFAAGSPVVMGPVASQNWEVALGDLNGDGWLDW